MAAGGGDGGVDDGALDREAGAVVHDEDGSGTGDREAVDLDFAVG